MQKMVTRNKTKKAFIHAEMLNYRYIAEQFSLYYYTSFNAILIIIVLVNDLGKKNKKIALPTRNTENIIRVQSYVKTGDLSMRSCVKGTKNKQSKEASSS